MFRALSALTPRVWAQLPVGAGEGPAPFRTWPPWITGMSPHARPQVADRNRVTRLRLSLRRPSSGGSSPTKRGSQQRGLSSPAPSASSSPPDQLCDPRLKHINVLNWTEVPITNDLAARLISFYLTVDHPILGLFDADLFLGDLVAHKTDFCCPLLLSAVLCFACVCR